MPKSIFFLGEGRGFESDKYHRHKGENGIFEYGVQTREKWVDKKWGKMQFGVAYDLT